MEQQQRCLTNLVAGFPVLQILVDTLLDIATVNELVYRVPESPASELQFSIGALAVRLASYARSLIAIASTDSANDGYCFCFYMGIATAVLVPVLFPRCMCDDEPDYLECLDAELAIHVLV